MKFWDKPYHGMVFSVESQEWQPGEMESVAKDLYYDHVKTAAKVMRGELADACEEMGVDLVHLLDYLGYVSHANAAAYAANDHTYLEAS